MRDQAPGRQSARSVKIQAPSSVEDLARRPNSHRSSLPAEARSDDEPSRRAAPPFPSLWWRADGFAMARIAFLGAETSPPKRMVQICTSFGLYGPSFFPRKPGRDYEPSEYLTILNDLRDQFTVFSGISHPEIGGDHASEACFLTSAKHPTKGGFRNTVSLDYVAAKHVAGATRFPLLTLSTLDSSPLTYTPSGAGVPALQQAVGDLRAHVPGRQQERRREEMDRLKRGQSVLDRMGDRFAELNKTLSQHDQQQLPTTPKRCATWNGNSRPTKPG